MLQGLADQVCATASWPARRHPASALRFGGFRLRDVDTLRTVVSRGERVARYWIDAGPPGRPEGTYNYSMPDEDFYCELPPDEEVDLCVTTDALRQVGTHEHDYYVWEAFCQLVDEARSAKPRLRRCRVPRPWTQHVDHELGEVAEDAPQCGTFYITDKDAHTCGRPVCKQNYTKLQNLEMEKKDRTRDIAWREWQKAGAPGHFDKLWERAGEDLLHFRAFPESTRPSQNGKM